MSPPHPLRAVLLAVLALASLGGCGAGDDDDEDDTVLTVFAAASLRSSFSELADEFERDHEGVELRFSFAGSSDLAAQIAEGAPADVFASADQPTMERLVDEGLVDAPQEFASNTLVVAVPPGNPSGIRTLADLADVALVTCAPAVPCGAAARAVADRAGVTLAPVSEEQSVTDVLGKVTSGEADAGLVYVTDVLASGGDVEAVEVPEAATVVNTYPVAVVTGTAEPGLAKAFLDLVTGPTGRGVLRDAGFGAP